MKAKHKGRCYKNNNNIIRRNSSRKDNKQEKFNIEEIAWAVEDRIASQRESSYADL